MLSSSAFLGQSNHHSPLTSFFRPKPGPRTVTLASYVTHVFDIKLDNAAGVRWPDKISQVFAIKRAVLLISYHLLSSSLGPLALYRFYKFYLI